MTVADRRARARGLRACVVASVVFAAGSASADRTGADVALAQSLFEQARTLMKAERFAEACPKLAESQRLDPAVGTLLNLAVCHEMSGKTATAWSEFHDALGIAKRENREDRARYARHHIEGLEPRLSGITIVRPPGQGAASTDVRLDGSPIRDASFGNPIHVDPGPHEIEATAPGKKRWSRSVDVGPSHDMKVIDVPVLEDAPLSSSQAKPHRAETRTAGLIIGGFGVAALGVGALAGIQAASKWSTRKIDCPGDVCDATGLDADKAARRWAIVSDVALGVGVIAVGVGTVLFVTSKRGEARAEVRAEAGPGRTGVVVRGVF